ncbi:MAG: protein-disulfide reductase DsbD [Armatimonadota bacterium]|nr:protein-disulfide reductase DsbD [bacterium]MDW8321047.1 protein-disulfide reductase DsbD [Armatimonadota bacterium]
MHRTIAGLFATLLLVTTAVAQFAPPKDALSVQATASVKQVVPGKPFEILVMLNIKHPYHVNANPASEKFLIPTSVAVEPVSGITFSQPHYPKGLMREFAFTGGKKIAVYEGKTVIRITATPAKNLKAGEVTVRGKVNYQACDERSCYPPGNLPFSLKLKVGTASSASASTEPVQAVVQTAESSPVGGSEGAAGSFSTAPGGAYLQKLQELLDAGRFGIALPIILLLGLLLNLTPCVYPLIPITISFFSRQTSGSQGRTFGLALVYVLGMALMYAALGTAAAALGKTFGFQLQNPWVLGGFAVILVALALSMFGVYQLQLPAGLRNKARLREGWLGALLMGLLVGVAAAPCVGPVVVALAAVVSGTGNVPLGFLLFLTLGLGLGIPYIVLAMFSGAIRRLPRSGEWMVAVEHLFGFALIGVAIFFLSPILPAVVYKWLMFAFLAGVGVYLVAIDKLAKTVRGFFLFKRLLGVALVAWAVMIALPTQKAKVGHIAWQPYSEALLQQALAERKPVIIDFYADWCLPCKELEANTFSDPRVAQKFDGVVALKADLTRDEDPAVQQLRKRFQIAGVPTIVFLDGLGREQRALRLVQFEPPDAFLKRMAQFHSAAQTAKR